MAFFVANMSSDRKRRGAPLRKPSFKGNKYMKVVVIDGKNVLVPRNSDSAIEGASNAVPSVSSLSKESETDSHTVEATPTRSQIKIEELYKAMQDSDDESDNQTADSDEDDFMNEDIITDDKLEGSRIVDMGIFGRNLSSQLVCRHCHCDVQLMEVKRQGLGSEYAFHCSNKNCNEQNSFPSCNKIPVGNSSVNSVNRRAVLAMRSIGGGRADLQTFCGIMDLPPPVHASSYNRVNKTLHDSACSVQAASMQRAAKIEREMAEPIEGEAVRDIDVSVDGTWMTRGHSSKVGVTSLIGCVTGKVLDAGVLSKTCKSCDFYSKKDKTSEEYRQWDAKHRPECTKTHTGSAGGMEAKIATTLFGHSVEKYQLRYARFIGDGDTNSFKSVFESKPYGDQLLVEKIECVGHVQKRMGTRLRKLKSSLSGKTLADGKSIGGRGRLTKEQIDSIQSYYGYAIRNNKNDLVKMREAVWGIFFHKGSSDEEPVHHFCKEACPYKQAEAEGRLATYKHTNTLPKAVMTEIKPVFKDLANTQLLKKCLEGYTQNANESLNNLIWKYCPKTKNHGLVVVETATALAVCIFNDGAVSLIKILEEMGLSAGKFCREFCEQKDVLRVLNAERRANEHSLVARRARRKARLAQEDQQEEAEGFPYQAGGH